MNLPGPLRVALIRFGLLIGFFAFAWLFILLGRRVGLGEWAILLGIFVAFFVIEAARFVIRRFLSGLRGEE